MNKYEAKLFIIALLWLTTIVGAYYVGYRAGVKFGRGFTTEETTK